MVGFVALIVSFVVAFAARTFAGEVCGASKWEKIYDYGELSLHFPILTDFGFLYDDDHNLFYTAKLEIFNYSLPETIVNVMSPALPHINGKNGNEDIVVTITVNTDSGLEIHQELFWDEEEEREPFEMPNRKVMPDGFKISSKFEIKPVEKNGKFSKTITGYAFSKENGLTKGLTYNLEYQTEAAKVLLSNFVIKYDEKVGLQKHTPRVVFPSVYKFTDMGDDSKQESSRAKILLPHAAKTESSEHFIHSIWVEDEFGRVVFFKKIDFDDYEVGESVDETFHIFNFAHGFRTLTPYEFCSEHGVFQGQTVFIPYEGEVDTENDTCHAL